ncbi:MAG: potassium channel family protein [Saccharofermentanales bacterium]
MYIIVVGCGRLGSNLAKELSDFGHDVCIIDRDKEKLDVLGSGFNGQKINSIEFDSDKLIQSGIKQADTLLALTPDDNINIMVSLIANEIYHVPQVIARVNDPNRKIIYDKLNIDNISLVKLGEELLLNRLTMKNFDVITHFNNDYQIIDIFISKKNIKISVEEIEKKYFCIISTINRQGVIFLPKQDDQILSGDRIICTINKSENEKLMKLSLKES